MDCFKSILATIFFIILIFFSILPVKASTLMYYYNDDTKSVLFPDFPSGVTDSTPALYVCERENEGRFWLAQLNDSNAFFYKKSDGNISASGSTTLYYKAKTNSNWIVYNTETNDSSGAINYVTRWFVNSNVVIYSDINKTSIYYSPTSIPSLDISFPTATTNLIGIAEGTDSTIEIEIGNYNVDEMPDFLNLNFYKKEGSNYNIYSIPIYIYNQFPTYVTQAPLNDDLFLFVHKSKLYSMGIDFKSNDEFYLFLSDDVAPKGYSTWNNNGTGLLLGSTFQTTEATIYDETGLVTIPTLTSEQEQDNQNQSDTQKQIDAINQQTEVQKETKDFLEDDNVDDENVQLPSIETNDITEDGIDNIFTAIYNGLTSGEARDIVLPFPFTNKSITIPANYTEQFLTTSVFSPIYLIIQAFYWYVIARFIVKDIASKFEKIKSGNIENLENNNIKTEML